MDEIKKDKEELRCIAETICRIMDEAKRKKDGTAFSLEIDQDGFSVALLDSRGYRIWTADSGDMTLEEALLSAHHQQLEH